MSSGLFIYYEKNIKANISLLKVFLQCQMSESHVYFCSLMVCSLFGKQKHRGLELHMKYKMLFHLKRVYHFFQTILGWKPVIVLVFVVVVVLSRHCR